MIDASTRVTVLNELLRLTKEEGMTALFITHYLRQAYYVSDRVGIMEKGKIVEKGRAETVLFRPESAFTSS